LDEANAERMKTLLRGGTIVAFDRGEHRILEHGVLVFEGNEIRFVGKGYEGPVDRTLGIEGKLVIPGLINTQVHAGLNTGDYLLNDVGRSEYFGANYLSFLAPLRGTMGPLPGEVVRTIREFCFVHLIKNGCTTVIDAGGVPGDWDEYMQLAGQVGLRVYFSPSFGSAEEIPRGAAQGNPLAGQPRISERTADLKRPWRRRIASTSRCFSTPASASSRCTRSSSDIEQRPSPGSVAWGKWGTPR
jgi:cytosine/adenosine deaminase-related metal-dependent hydrolase